ncbi:MAG: hypothetical protein ACXACO_22485, partial [Promethearchaeota archaeon]
YHLLIWIDPFLICSEDIYVIRGKKKIKIITKTIKERKWFKLIPNSIMLAETKNVSITLSETIINLNENSENVEL